MSGSEFKISVDIAQLLPLSASVDENSFPHLAYAVQRVAKEVQAQWVLYASGAPMPNGSVIHNRTGEYQRSIEYRQTGPFSALVYSNLPYANAIEEGTPSRDMKVMLSSSLKVRMTKDGRRYLIIPFRWNVPNSIGSGNTMASPVHDFWKKVPKSGSSAITGTYRRISGTGAHDIKTRQPLPVRGWKYSWGTRLSHGDLEGMGLSKKQESHMAGMVRFRPQKGKSAAGSSYLTFRVMMEGSKGWIAKAVAGKYPARTTATQFQPIAEQAFAAAVEMDIKALMGVD
jgi:hypothetical protein